MVIVGKLDCCNNLFVALTQVATLSAQTGYVKQEHSSPVFSNAGQTTPSPKQQQQQWKHNSNSITWLVVVVVWRRDQVGQSGKQPHLQIIIETGKYTANRMNSLEGFSVGGGGVWLAVIYEPTWGMELDSLSQQER